MITERPYNWSKWLSLAKHWYNTNFHSAIQISPFEVLYGYPPPIHISYFPRDTAITAVDQQLQNKEDMIKVLK